MRFGLEALAPDRFEQFLVAQREFVAAEAVERRVGQRGRQPVTVALHDLAAQVPEHEPRHGGGRLLRRQELRDLRQVFAFVRGHRIVVGLGHPPRDVAARADQRIGDARTENRRAAAARDVGDERDPPVELGAESGLIPPHPPAAQAHEQRGHPAVGTRADAGARGGHRAIDHAVAGELGEERRHQFGRRLHADRALHRHHRRNARIGQPRPERGQRG